MSSLFPVPGTALRPTTTGLFDDLDRVRAQLLDAFGSTPTMEYGWAAALSDLEEKDDEYVVNVEVPGFDRGDIRIEMEGRRLTVHAEREEAEREGTLRSSTRSSGRIHHEMILPADVDPENIQASLDRGVLTIRIPKSEEAGRRRIEIG